MTKDKEETEEFTSSDEYEESALTALEKGAPHAATVYSTLALMATIREATFLIADILAPEDDDEDADAEEEAE